MRLDSYLVHVGLGSKKEMKLAIQGGRVSVNGRPVKRSDEKIMPDNDRVLFDNEVVNYQAHYYYMYHKPSGVICAKTDKKEKTIMDTLPSSLVNQGVFPVGRLDKDTTGLLFLTTDGKWDHKLRHPKSEKEKLYYLRYEGKLLSNAEALVRQGLDLGDFVTMPAKLVLFGTNEAYLSIKEGKFHQVKRMIKVLGGEVIRLHRLKIGCLTLDEALEEGKWRALTDEEIINLGG